MTRLLGAAAIICAALALVAVHARTAATPRWTLTPTGSTARLRGISAVSDRVVWASGADGTILRTADGGRTWAPLRIPDTSTLDFRDVDAIDERTAYVLSIGPGEASRIYKTTDAGATWTLQFRNTNPQAFFDAMTFRDARTGYAISDSIDGRLLVIRTTDGSTWTPLPPEHLPAALPGEGAFAASGTNIAISGRSVWLATTAARVLRTTDEGATWHAATTPLPTSASAGIFSIAFRDERRGIVVGGDYKQEKVAGRVAAVTEDGRRDMGFGDRAWRVSFRGRIPAGARRRRRRGGSVGE